MQTETNDTQDNAEDIFAMLRVMIPNAFDNFNQQTILSECDIARYIMHRFFPNVFSGERFQFDFDFSTSLEEAEFVLFRLIQSRDSGELTDGTAAAFGTLMLTYLKTCEATEAANRMAALDELAKIVNPQFVGCKLAPVGMGGGL